MLRGVLPLLRYTVACRAGLQANLQFYPDRHNVQRIAAVNSPTLNNQGANREGNFSRWLKPSAAAATADRMAI